MIDTDFKYAQWSTNVNVSGMNWQTYHEGMWFNPAEKTYAEAIEEIKETIRQKVLQDHPHLIAFDKQEDKPPQLVQFENGRTILVPYKQSGIKKESAESTTEAIKKEMRTYKLGASIFKKVFEYVKGNPELEEVYNEKLLELSKK